MKEWRSTVNGNKVVLKFRKPKGAEYGIVRKRGDTYYVDINPEQSAVDLVDTIIHELLHVAAWGIDEQYVHWTATDITRCLQRNGFLHEPPH